MFAVYYPSIPKPYTKTPLYQSSTHPISIYITTFFLPVAFLPLVQAHIHPTSLTSASGFMLFSLAGLNFKHCL